MINVLRFLTRHATVLVLIIISCHDSVIAQVPAKQWDKTFGGDRRENLHVVRSTSDGGVIVGGLSFSTPGSGTRTQANRGQADYWVYKLDAQGNTQWERALGGVYSDQLYALEQTSDGGYILAGNSGSPIGGEKTQNPKGDIDFWLVKLDANGTKLWDKAVGGVKAAHLQALSLTRDGGYIVGGLSDSAIGNDKTEANRGDFDFWVVKLDAAGNKQWDRTMGTTTYDDLRAVQQTADGGYLAGGYTDAGISGDKTQPGRGGSDMWVIKFDASGTKLWDKAIGGSREDGLSTLQATSDGGALLGGYSNSGISGDKSQASRGDYDFWIVKINANGTKQWDRAYGGTMGESLADLYPTADGGYILGGVSNSGTGGDKSQSGQGGYDFWIVKIDVSGTKQWDRTFGGSDDDILLSLRPTANSGYILGGDSKSGNSGDKTGPYYGLEDYWVVKLDGTTTAISQARRIQTLQVYPNPSIGNLTVRLAEDAPRTNLRLTLFDALGRTAYKQLVIATNSDIVLNLGNHQTGLYLLRLEGPEGYVATQHVALE